MKRALFFLLLLISFEGFGQVKQKPLSYGVEYSRVQADSAFRIPTVTVGIKNAYAGLDTAQLYYNKTDSGVYVYTGSQWRSVGGSGSTPSWQQTLTAGANRTAAVSSSGSNLYDFTFDSTQFKVKGVYGSGQTIVSFTSSQMFFNPRKGAFRAGFSSGTQWNNSNVGEISFASGAETIASGQTSTAMGSGSVANATYSVAIGNTNIASGTSSLAMVKESVSSGDASAAIGLGLKSKSYGGFVVGSYNDSTNAADPSDFNTANRVFQVGIGSADAARANAMTILYSGNVGIGTTSPSQLLHVNGIAQIGTAGSTLGQLNISGNTSGTITIKPQAAAGTYNFNLPTTAGTSGYFLTSGGGGGTAMTWTQNNFLTAIPGIDDVLGMGQKLTMAREIDTDGFDLAVGDVSGTVNRNRWELVDASNKMFYTNTDNTGQFGINTSTPTGALHVKANAGAINALFVDNSSGNVGIGTSTPAATLHVTGSSGTTLRVVDGNQGAGKILVSDADGDASWATSASALTTPISSLTAATGTNSINNGGFQQAWAWNSLAGSAGLYLSTSSTTATGNSQRLLELSLSGTNATSSQTTFGLLIENAHDGIGSLNYGADIAANDGATNIAGRFSASGGTNNYAIIVPASSGNVGIGTSTPAKIFHTVGTVRHASLGTASSDTTTYKPLGIDANGDVLPMTYWPGGGGGGWAVTGTTTITGAALIDMASNAVTVSQTTGGTATNAFRPYKVYTALLTQSGTSAPTATVLENTLGGTVVWTRNYAGNYSATLSGVFTTNKTWMNIVNTTEGLNNCASNCIWISANEIQLNNCGADDEYTNEYSCIEIRVYYAP